MLAGRPPTESLQMAIEFLLGDRLKLTLKPGL